MLGVKQRFFAPIPHDVSLEDLLPRDNLFYRRLEEKLDLSFVRELVRPLCTPKAAGPASTLWSSFAYNC